MVFFTFNEPRQVTFKSLPKVLIYDGAESFPSVRAVSRIIEPLMDDQCKALFYTVKPHCEWAERILTIRKSWIPPISRRVGESRYPSTLDIEVPQLILLHTNYDNKERIDREFCDKIYQDISLYANIGVLDMWFDWFDVKEKNYLDIMRHLYYFDLDLYLDCFTQPMNVILHSAALEKYAQPLETNGWTDKKTDKRRLSSLFTASGNSFWKRHMATCRKTNDE